MGYRIGDFIPCEWCGAEAVDVHHLIPRGSGGSKTKDYLTNLMALCRKCHLDAEARKMPREKLQERHLCNMADLGLVDFVIQESPVLNKLPENWGKIKIDTLHGTKIFNNKI